MFITRATRHDKADIEDFLRANEWCEELGKGVTFFARDGGVVGCVRLVEAAPQTVVVEDMVVDGSRRGQGIGTSLMQAAMNSRGGTLYLTSHEETLRFYGRLGFEAMPPEELPERVRGYFEAEGDLPTPPNHPQHFFLKAR